MGMGSLAALHGPAHNAPGVEVNEDSQIGKAFSRLEIRNVGDLGLSSALTLNW